MTTVRPLSIRSLTKRDRRVPASGLPSPLLMLALPVSIQDFRDVLIMQLICHTSLVTLIGEAVFSRCLSSIKEERVRASKAIAGPQKEPFRGDKQLFIDDLEQALYASKII